MNKTRLEISTWTIVKIILVLVLLWFVWAVRDIILLFMVVLILVAAFGPVVDRLQRYKVPRIVTVISLYLIFLGILSFVGYLIVPPLTNQVRELSNNFPSYWEKITSYFNLAQQFYNNKIPQQSVPALTSGLGKYSLNVFSTTIGFIGGLLSMVTALVLTFYLLLEEHSFSKVVSSLLPLKHQDQIAQIAHQISDKWGAWMRGQLVLSSIVGVISLIGLAIIGVPYALTLAIWAAFTEFIPYIGPILGAIPAILIALTDSFWKGLIVAIFYILVQQLEGHILVPKVMQKSVGLSPVLIILAILVGGKLGGILGVVLAIPLAAGVFVLLDEWIKFRTSLQEKNLM